MVKSSFLTVAAALTISMASVVRAPELDIFPPIAGTLEKCLSHLSKDGDCPGIWTFSELLDTLKPQEYELNIIRLSSR